MFLVLVLVITVSVLYATSLLLLLMCSCYLVLFFLPFHRFDVISGNKFAWSSSHFSFGAVSHIFLAHI